MRRNDGSRLATPHTPYTVSVVFHTEKSQPHKLHIWFFADTQAKAEKTKRAIF